MLARRLLTARFIQCLPIALLAATAPTAPITFDEIADRA